MRKINLEGKIFGKLIVLNDSISREMPNGDKLVHWKCKCDCGVEKYIDSKTLRKGRAKSCGCAKPLVLPAVELDNFLGFKRRLYRNCKNGAIARDLEFKINFEEFEILISRKCSYCGCLPDKSKKNKKGEIFNYLGVDRRNNDIGYTINNCVPCCWNCNVAKHDSSEEEFLKLIRNITSHRRLGTVKNAIITGVCGQDGSYLADILLEKGYQVIGINRRGSDRDPWRIKHLLGNPNFKLESGDVTDYGRIYSLIKQYLPIEFYHLAANSFVGDSWNLPVSTTMNNSLGTVNCLDAIRNSKLPIKFYNAASSEMYGRVLETPQTENTKFNALSPYAATKVFAFDMTRIYRESFGIFGCNGILFNHESPRRSIEFVTRKITDGVARIKKAGGGQLKLGNIDAKRDWGHAKDYCEGMYLMLQQDKPGDYVLSSNETHSIKEFLEIAFSYAGLKWQDYVVQDEQFMRPNDVQLLLGDSSKARKVLGWQPKYTFEDLVREMVQEDLKRHGVS